MLTTRTPRTQFGWVATDEVTGAYLLPLTYWQGAQPPRYLLALPVDGDVMNHDARRYATISAPTLESAMRAADGVVKKWRTQ
jgi:hypothetical protein